RMIERRGHPGLAEESLDAKRIGGAIGGKDFQRDAAAERFIDGLVNFAHPARADGTRDAIAPETGSRCDRRSHVRKRIRHADDLVSKRAVAVVYFASRFMPLRARSTRCTGEPTMPSASRNWFSR